MCLGVDQMHLCLEISVLLKQISVSLPRLGKFPAIMSSNMFFAPNSPHSSSETPDANISILDAVAEVSQTV